MTIHLTWAEVSARRMRRHGLGPVARDDQPAVDLVEMAATMCGVHAQVMSAAEVSLGIRVPGSTREHVRDALWRDHTLVKTYGPRGTVHLLPARDLAMWVGALSLRPALTSLPEGVRLDGEQTEQVVAAIGAALAEAELTMDELDAAVIARTGPWAAELVVPNFGGDAPRWRMAIGTAAARGVLCFGPGRGRKVTYVDPRRLVPGFVPPVASRAALAELARRFLFAYGPATPAQFGRWLGASPALATDLFDEMVDDLDPVRVEGTEDTAYVNLGDTEADGGDAHRGVRLLPYFDAYVVGSHPRELLFAGRAATRAAPGGQAGPYPVMLVDGVVAGVWHQRTAGRRARLTVEPFARLTAGQRRELGDRAARIAQVAGVTTQVAIGRVTVAPHR